MRLREKLSRLATDASEDIVAYAMQVTVSRTSTGSFRAGLPPSILCLLVSYFSFLLFTFQIMPVWLQYPEESASCSC